MTNIRSSGFDSPAQLREHLADTEPDDQDEPDERSRDNNAVLRELEWLRPDVAVLRKQLTANQNREVTSPGPAQDHPWVRILVGVAVTTVLGAISRRLRLGAAGATAVPSLPRN